MVLVIALTFVIIVLFGIIYSLIKSSGEISDIEQMDTYTDPVDEDTLRRLQIYREYIQKLDEWRNQQIITQQDYEEEMEQIEVILEEIEEEMK